MFGLNRYTHISIIGQALVILPIDLLHLKFITITVRLMNSHLLTNPDTVQDLNKILIQINLKFMETERVDIFNQIKILLLNYNFDNS